MATTTATEEASRLSLCTVAPQQPDLRSSTELNSVAKTEIQLDSEEKEEDVNGGGSNNKQKEMKENAVEAHLDPEWVEERFRIDRKKLESMLHDPRSSDSETCEEFFQRVMKETNTQVKWPSKLKIGAKSKKDPHVKVEGTKKNVMEAKARILAVLETKVNKVTLKMDVAYTEHSHVIGKGGGNIKRVMESTSCHIHFPDSNRHNAAGEKSNQVSIAGSVEGVEEARRKIRDLQPLSLSFDLPVSLQPQAFPDMSSPLIQQVVQAFGVSVSFKALPSQPQSQPCFYGGCCTVWGLQGNTAAVKKATCVLMELLLGAEVAGGLVSSQMDVTTQQHLFLLGQSGTQFLNIKQQTQTQIILPDLSASQSSPSLLIHGSLDGVCLARQQLMDCLPVCLMFDMHEDREVDSCKLTQIMQNQGVFISVKPKVKQTSKSVVVKGLERNICNVYGARRVVLGLDPGENMEVMGLGADSIFPGGGMADYWLDMLLQQLRPSEHGFSLVSSAEMSVCKPRPSPPPGLTPPSKEGRAGLRGTDSQPLKKIIENQSDHSDDENSELMSKIEGCDAAVNNYSRVGLNSRRGSLQSPEINKILSQGRRHSTGQTPTYGLLNPETNGWRSERRSSLRSDMSLAPSVCADSSTLEYYDYEKKKLLATRAMQKKPVVTEVRTPTDTWSGLGFSKSMPAEAIKELQNFNRRNYKLYLSTIDGQQQSWAAQVGKTCNGSDSENWRDRRGSACHTITPSSPPTSSPSPGITFTSSTSSAFPSPVDVNCGEILSGSFVNSSLFERPLRRMTTCRQQSSSPVAATDDLPELLSQLGLIKYINVFEQQEIDYQTFLTLSDEDLKEVGVSTFGARRKMLLAITDLNKGKRRVSDTPAVKPGYLEGGASGRLPRIIDVDIAPQSDRW